MPRLLFEKTGNAIWISHLDLMRVFQRAFKRAGLALTHTKGFNPRPSVSIALPMSVGISSCCELLDFDLDGESVSNEEICTKLNQALVNGIRVLHVYSEARKIRDIAFLDCKLTLEYDAGTAEDAAPQIQALFRQEHLIMEKRNKNGVSQQDIIPLIQKLDVSAADRNTLVLSARVCCQNPSLNPMQLHGAIVQYLPEYAPDYTACERIEIFDNTQTIFR